MNWDFAIERQRVSLLARVIGLFAMIGLTEGIMIERLSKPLYREVLGILRTAESAVRRLIYVAARNIVLEPRPKRPARPRSKTPSKAETKADGEAKAKRKRGFLFRLFDPPRRFAKGYRRQPKPRQAVPRVHFFGYDPRIPEFLRAHFAPAPAAPAPPPVVEGKVTVDDGTVSAANLIRRLHAVVDALRDIPRHAMRLARWQAQPVEERRPPRSSPLRTGRPPGWRQRSKHEVDEILKECDWLARNVMPPLDDTS